MFLQRRSFLHAGAATWESRRERRSTAAQGVRVRVHVRVRARVRVRVRVRVHVHARPCEHRRIVQLSRSDRRSAWCTLPRPLPQARRCVQRQQSPDALACDSRTPRAQQSEHTCDLCASGRLQPRYTRRQHATRCVPLCSERPTHARARRALLIPSQPPLTSVSLRAASRTKTAIWHAAANPAPILQ